MELKDVQKIVKEMKETMDKKHNLKWSPFALMTDLMEEVGELAENIKSINGFSPGKNIPKENISREVSDILFSLLCIANYYGVDVESSFKSVVNNYKERFL